MRLIDNYIGKPVCYLLSLYACLKDFLPKKKPGKIDTILFSKYFGMGSIVHATPLMRAVKKKYPESKIIFLSFSSNERFLKTLPEIDEVVCLRTGGLVELSLSVVSALYRLRRMKVDVVFNLEFFSKFGTIMSFLTGAHSTSGYFLQEHWRYRLVTHRVYYNHYKHISEIFMALGENFGVSTQDYTLSKPEINDSDRAVITEILNKNHLVEKDFIVAINVNAGSLSTNRCWPLSSFAELTRLILEKHKAKVILVGGIVDVLNVDNFIKLLGQDRAVINLAGKISIEQLLALFEKVNLFITNDSGPLHLAIMMDTPTISFFGPETPTLYGPGENKKHTVFFKGDYCSPCLHVYNEKTWECRENICLKKITVKEVFEAVEEKYKEKLKI